MFALDGAITARKIKLALDDSAKVKKYEIGELLGSAKDVSIAGKVNKVDFFLKALEKSLSQLQKVANRLETSVVDLLFPEPPQGIHSSDEAVSKRLDTIERKLEDVLTAITEKDSRAP